MGKRSGSVAAAGHLSVAILVVWTTACGDSGTPAAPAVGGRSFEPGVFESALNFQAQCDEPRTGTNPLTNSPYPDLQGTTTDENNFLRSYSNDTYLWYDEIVDRNPALFDDPIEYFDLLKTDAVTPSGQPKDKFHFTVDTEQYASLAQSGVAVGYGVEWIVLSVVPPREVLVAYTQPDSPATEPEVNLVRGARVLEADGVSIDTATEDGMAALNAALFPLAAGETHVFVVQDQGSESSRSVTITSAAIESKAVQNVRVLDTPTGRVGYMLFNDHIATAELELINAVNQLAAGDGIDDLVLDMRYNGGGFLAIASELAFMIAGPEATADRTFELTEFNDKHPDNDPITGEPIVPIPFLDTTLGPPFSAPADEALPALDLPRVFVITGSGTCSASEAIMNGLRGIDVEVIQVGSTTCGKPYGFYPIDNCGTTYFTVQFKGVNDKGVGDYADGFSPENADAPLGVVVPGCSVPDDFTAELGDAAEARLAAALTYRSDQSCPEVAAFAAGATAKSGERPVAADGLLVKPPWRTNRILLP